MRYLLRPRIGCPLGGGYLDLHFRWLAIMILLIGLSATMWETRPCFRKCTWVPFRSPSGTGKRSTDGSFYRDMTSEGGPMGWNAAGRLLKT